jgi:hypothetical protein
LHFVGQKTNFVGIKINFVGLNCTLLKENPLKMSEFLKNKYFFSAESPSHILIPVKDDFLEGKCPIVLPEFVKNKNLVRGKSLVLPEFLKNRYFFKRKSPKKF